ncbi:energy transducer TonB [Luteimonas sp. MC1782]|uniref:energy transducer TonB n=1 Tax=Luteimonas sp. MC1782 TaxID=2760305 RepID=UPI0016036A48|nr:energy transducer TonB [Luteimonas sp. MC1782]MBB1473516.1 energy transducer TonB [Luteimonas sp. MC1782]
MRLGLPVAALAAALLACACQPQSPPAAGADAVDGPGAATGSTAAPAVDLSRRPIDDLKASGSRALREGRLHAPAGDSAIEYWLEARRRDPDDAALASAITDLQPYLLIACEQAIARRDVGAAQRLHGLIAASDPHAPALQRLAGAIAGVEADIEEGAKAAREQDMRLAAVEVQRVRADADARAAATVRVATPAGAGPTPALPPPAAPQRPPPLADGDAVPAPAGALPPAGARAAAVAESPAPVPRLLHQPAPRYPAAALNRRVEGAVQVGFTIRPDGSVTAARVVSATPPGVFDRSALAAVGEYRFAPGGSSVASAITVRFSLDQ